MARALPVYASPCRSPDTTQHSVRVVVSLARARLTLASCDEDFDVYCTFPPPRLRLAHLFSFSAGFPHGLRPG